jgi:Fe-S cluster assembly protein SufB
MKKTIGYENSKTYFRGYVNIKKSAKNSYSKIVCDNLLLSPNLESYTYPYEKIENMSSVIEHEAQISKISEEQLFFLTSKGFNNKKAENLLVLGFIDQFNKELPMEYAVELNRLMK